MGVVGEKETKESEEMEGEEWKRLGVVGEKEMDG